jgi:hypothetical protein
VEYSTVQNITEHYNTFQILTNAYAEHDSINTDKGLNKPEIAKYNIQ